MAGIAAAVAKALLFTKSRREILLIFIKNSPIFITVKRGKRYLILIYMIKCSLKEFENNRTKLSKQVGIKSQFRKCGHNLNSINSGFILMNPKWEVKFFLFFI